MQGGADYVSEWQQRSQKCNHLDDKVEGREGVAPGQQFPDGLRCYVVRQVACCKQPAGRTDLHGGACMNI